MNPNTTGFSQLTCHESYFSRAILAVLNPHGGFTVVVVVVGEKKEEQTLDNALQNQAPSLVPLSTYLLL